MPGNRPLVLLTLSGFLIFPLPGKSEPRPESDSDALFPGDFSEWIDIGIPWCTLQPSAMPSRPAEGETDANVLIDADSATFDDRTESVLFSGDVEINYQETRIKAREISYNRRTEILESNQPFYLQQPGIRVVGSRARFDLSTEQGTADDVEYRLPLTPARGHATAAEIQDREHFFFRQPTYTTCPPGDDGWQLVAADLAVDQESGVGTAHDATLRFKDVPFIYLPYAEFPVDDRRKSGFLAPSVGQSGNTGFDFSLPYYFNIAPNMDATLIPRIMSKRGVALGGEFRYLQEWHSGELRAELLPDDQERESDAPDIRGALSYRGRATPAERWLIDTDISYASDDDFLEDLGESVALTSKKQLDRRADLRYSGKQWRLLARAQDFQTIAENTAEPYSRLPQLLANFDAGDLPYGLDLGIRSEYVYFYHDNKERGHRFDIHPSLSLPLEREWGFFTPRVSTRYTAYQLEHRAAGLPDNPDRFVSSFSIDGGLFFERDTNWLGTAGTQTLEPRLYYLYTSREDQSDLPVFDSAETTFSFNGLFRENRFSGSDRVGDANQLTAALTTRFFDYDRGRELISASLGQIIYFEDREVQLPGTGISTDSSSSVVAEVSARLGGGWSTRANIQWNPHASKSRTEQSAASIRYLDRDNRAFNLAYRFTDGELEDADLSMLVPVSGKMNLIGRWNYSILHNQTMGAFAGIEYNSCCWTARVALRQLVTEVDQDPDVGIFFQLELKGLTRLGSRIDDLVKREILGYETDY